MPAREDEGKKETGNTGQRGQEQVSFKREWVELRLRIVRHEKDTEQIHEKGKR